MSFELLLAHADTLQPVLGSGLDRLPTESSAELPPLPTHLWSATGDLDDFPAQRWGIVAPKGPVGDRLLELVAPLQELRQREQGGAEVKTYRVEPDMDLAKSYRWKASKFGEDAPRERERPRYLLLLGDLDQVSLELQQALAIDALVGRLAFPTDDGYRAYVEKALRWASAPTPAPRARLLFYTALDGSSATSIGHHKLVGPCIESCLDARNEGHLSAEPPVPLADEGRAPGALARFRAYAAGAEPSVLLSLSHGLGSPRGGWSNSTHRRATQGALLLPNGEHVTAAELSSGAFLPGGLWFCFACFSAGTPSRSVYAHWLEDVDPVWAPRARGLLPSSEEGPFIAALPQAALANPDGPLAVVGHVDLAWTSSFHDRGYDKHSRFAGVLQSLAEGRRAGSALFNLLRAVSTTAAKLVPAYDKVRAAQSSGTKARVDRYEQALLWMRYHDLSNFILLGDPAVRLPIRRRDGIG